jgi:diguanylate cyclase (GGDEF)-like protein/PAS domain S-box-containing protein
LSDRRQRLLRRQAERLRLRMERANSRERLLATVFEASREGIAITDAEQRFVEVNSSFTALTGYALDELRGQQPLMLFGVPAEAAQLQRIQRRLDEHGVWEGEGPLRRRDGSTLPVAFSVVAVRDAEGLARHYALVFDDISVRKAHEADLERSAHYDPLTGIPNRRLFMDRLHQALAQARRHGEKPALAMLDLDGFKPVNDRYGHEAGDQVLIETGRRLQSLLRAEDTVARIGGDEFVLLLRHPGGEAVWQRILAAVRAPIALTEGGEAQVRASIGVALFDPEQPGEQDGESLLRLADRALYTSKSQGRDRYTIHSPLSINNAWGAPPRRR